MAPNPQPQWFKSSYSGSPNNECVECANTPQAVLLRDSKNPDGPSFGYSYEAWRQFLTALRTDTLHPC